MTALSSRLSRTHHSTHFILPALANIKAHSLFVVNAGADNRAFVCAGDATGRRQYIEWRGQAGRRAAPVVIGYNDGCAGSLTFLCRPDSQDACHPRRGRPRMPSLTGDGPAHLE